MAPCTDWQPGPTWTVAACKEAEAIVLPPLPLSLPKLRRRLVVGSGRRFNLWGWRCGAIDVVENQF